MSSDISESGVMGDAKAATKEKGQRWLELGAAALAQKISSLDSTNPRG
jgi:creatinine amidohydrolase